ncbi:chemotaxis protein CheC [Ammoniphilus sp. YIM 78166]|uniref:chemotaxis protein CheC n=1 Tax=Ammoniphilus sp. YIM 78166 TaxID=1644106 RepID=UPI00106F589B|nr:chemotaxis protein CheC [Ammoniphilus sp. YIM 78166]
MNKGFGNFGEFQFDVLKEIGNIGAGHATTALSKLIAKDVDMLVPHVQIVGFDEIADSVGGPEKVVVAVFLRILGDIPGNMFFIMDQSSAYSLVKETLGTEPAGEELTELEKSALCEVGNILIGSYLSSLADFTQLNLQPSVPALAVDMAGAVLSYGLIELGQSSDYALAIDTVFFEGSEAVQGHFFLLPDPAYLGKIFSSLGVPLE